MATAPEPTTTRSIWATATARSRPDALCARWNGLSTAIVTGDFTGNGRTDLAITRTSPDDVQVRLTNGDGTFSDPSVVDLVRRETPLVADINGDGARMFRSSTRPATSSIARAGQASPAASRPRSRSTRATLARHRFCHDSSTARRSPVSTPTTTRSRSSSSAPTVSSWLPSSPPVPSRPRFSSADLNGNGITDLIVRNAGDGTISVFPGDGHGWFLPRVISQVGLGVSDIEVADLEQDGLLDIVYTNRISGEVGVLDNLGGGAFVSPVLYRAGPGPYGVTGTADPSPVSSLEGTTSVAVGTFTPGGLPSLVALDPGSNTLGLLSGLGGGLLANPTYIATPSTGLVVRAVDFSGNGLTGLAVLGPDGLDIYKSDGHGGFLPPTDYDVGFEPNGLTVADLTGNGKADLLVSNPLGDVQVLIGNGDGTFQPVQNLDTQVAPGGLCHGGHGAGRVHLRRSG